MSSSAKTVSNEHGFHRSPLLADTLPLLLFVPACGDEGGIVSPSPVLVAQASMLSSITDVTIAKNGEGTVPFSLDGSGSVRVVLSWTPATEIQAYIVRVGSWVSCNGCSPYVTVASGSDQDAPIELTAHVDRGEYMLLVRNPGAEDASLSAGIWFTPDGERRDP